MGIEKGESPIDLVGQFETIKRILQDHPKARESDARLVAIIWNAHLGSRIKTMTAFELLSEFANGKLPKVKSLERVARKVKEMYPELEGENQDEREHLQADVIVQLHQIDSEATKNNLLA